MRHIRLIISCLVAICMAGCNTLPQPQPFYDEEAVLRVWDALDAYYGREAFFECEYLPVIEGKIEVIKPYNVSDIAVVAHSDSTREPVFFHAVQSNPGANEFLVEGTTLHFHPSYENQSLFVAWIPDLSETHRGTQRRKVGAEK